VPPDAFSETGQLWGSPLYDWKAHAAEDFAWWRQRIARCMQVGWQAGQQGLAAALAP
jgi:4-alpha-glucanotransferase